MTDHTRQHDTNEESPDEILERFLGEHSLDDAAAFDELLSKHPRHAEFLRRLAREIRRTFAQDAPFVRAFDPPDRLKPLFTRLRRADEQDARRFDSGEEIGRGGMGVVLCIRDHALRRDVAKKSIRDDRKNGERAERAIERFVDEAQITAQLDHPGVVPVHDLGLEIDGSPYFTMRRVRGEDLRAIFSKTRNGEEGWTLPRAVAVLLRVCETMAYAHEKNVIHRDLKPDNVMVGRYGEVYVMDWGLARTLGKPDPRDLRMKFAPMPTSHASTDVRDDGSPDEVLITADGAILGTPVYMPPEQAAGDTANLGTTADIYALGAMLYELLAGHQPYVRPGTTASGRMVLRWILDGPPHPLSQVARKAPPELVAICDRAMARDFRQRYASMSAFADDLRAWLEGRVVNAYRSGSWAELSAWVKRNRTTAITSASLVIVIVGASILSAWLFREQAAASKDAEAERGLRLDVREADALIREAMESWPIHPDSLPGIDDWLHRAEGILARRSQHATPVSDADAENTADVVPDPRSSSERTKLRTLIDTLEDVESRLADPSDKSFSIETLEATKAAVVEELAWRQRRSHRDELMARINAIDARARGAVGRDDDIRRIHARAVALGDPNHGWLREVRSRRDLAATLASRSIGEYEADWRVAIDSLAKTSALPPETESKFEPQIGLVPLGPDPVSGLQEFWHVLSGERPIRDENGRFRIDGTTGLVFVLIPGGRYLIGAQREDPQSALHDPNARAGEFVREVVLSPFLISKYEMTLGQWIRIDDSLPSEFHAGYPPRGQPFPNFAHPVESIAWYDVARALRRWSLDMPTEAQWEVAARAGRTTPSSLSTQDVPSLRAVNGFDGGDRGVGGALDGFGVHAPVDRFDPNPFGLFNTLGNVAEYCADWYHPSYDPSWESPNDHLVTPPFLNLKSERGGSYVTIPSDLRFAYRDKNKPEHGRRSTGVRPRFPIRTMSSE